MFIELTRDLGQTGKYKRGQVLDWNRATITGVCEHEGGRDWYRPLANAPGESVTATAFTRRKREPVSA